MLRTLAISSFLFAGVVTVANADVYRWVDDHGGVHYSDQWTPGSQLIKSARNRPSNTVSDTSSRRAADSSKATPPPTYTSSSGDQAAAAKAVKEDRAKIREQQCKEAKDRYDKAILARRIYKASDGADKSKEDPDNREYLSDEQADAYRVQARQEMQELCGDSAK